MPTPSNPPPPTFAEIMAEGAAFLAKAKAELAAMRPPVDLRPRRRGPSPAMTTIAAPAAARHPYRGKKISDLSAEVNRVFDIIADRMHDAEKLHQEGLVTPKHAAPKQSEGGRSEGGWSPERRARQSALMHRLQPWKKSTGPRTDEGKARASQNARKSSRPPSLYQQHRAAVRRNTERLRIARRVHRQYSVFLRGETNALHRLMSKKTIPANSSFHEPAHTLNTSFTWLRDELKKCPAIENPELEARLIVKHCIPGTTDAALIAGDQTPITLDQYNALLIALCGRTDIGEPLSRILGVAEFWSLKFRVTKDVLDPRADTETLVEAAVKTYAGLPPPEKILDLGTGSGCILIALLSEFPTARGIGVDISPAALAIAAENAQTNGVTERAQFIKGDWFDFPPTPTPSSSGLTGGSHASEATISTGSPACAEDDTVEKFELILSNPPYIESGIIPNLERGVRQFDPRRALDGGPDGLDAYKRIIDALPERLTPAGVCFLEIGRGQGAAIKDLCEKRGLRLLESYADLAGIERCLKITLGTK